MAQRKAVVAAIGANRRFRAVSEDKVVTLDNKIQVWHEPEGFTYRNFARAPSVHGVRLSFPKLMDTIKLFG